MKSSFCRTSNNPSPSSLLKREFLKKWIKGIHTYTNIYKFKKDRMTVLERENAIKLSADWAIASTRNPSTHWSRSLISNIPSSEENLVNTIVWKTSGGNLINFNKDNNNNSHKTKPLITCTKKILGRSKLSRIVKARGRNSVKASSIAKRLLRNKTRLLKSLIPGGEHIEDDVSLIKETLDYITWLHVQVDVMRRVANTAERLNCSGDYKARCNN